MASAWWRILWSMFSRGTHWFGLCLVHVHGVVFHPSFPSFHLGHVFLPRACALHHRRRRSSQTHLHVAPPDRSTQPTLTHHLPIALTLSMGVDGEGLEKAGDGTVTDRSRRKGWESGSTSKRKNERMEVRETTTERRKEMHPWIASDRTWKRKRSYGNRPKNTAWCGTEPTVEEARVPGVSDVHVCKMREPSRLPKRWRWVKCRARCHVAIHIRPM